MRRKMSSKRMNRGTESSVLSLLERLPLVSFYARTRGWHYIICWCNRIAGLLLVIWLWLHIYFLTSLYHPSAYDKNMKIFSFFILAFMQWVLSIPVIFHAVNGGRLILYEIFGIRNDATMVRWMLGLSFLYAGLLGFIMILGNQSASPFFFWLFMLLGALVCGYIVTQRIWESKHSIFWKLQRMSGGFLLVMVPAHLLFMHLNPSAGMEAAVVIERMQSGFVKAVDLLLVLTALYHGSYGLFSVLSEYLSSKILRKGLVCIVAFIALVFAWMGIRLILTI
jgi:succinate dehydrogenase hydrophobic anchor subunit